MKKFFKEFVEFINKGNALALAIGVIIGAAFTNIVSTINGSVITPLISVLLNNSNLAEAGLVTPLADAVLDAEGNVISEAIFINWGALIQSILDFLLTALILFLIFKIVTAFINHARKSAEKLHKRVHKIENHVVEEPVVVEVAPEVVEPTPSAEVLLLTEIRDLLSKKENE